MKKKLFIDFDRTLFDTLRFWDDLDLAITKKFGLKKGSLTENYLSFSVSNGDLRMVDYNMMIHNLGVSKKDLSLFLSKIIRLEINNYIYPDGIEFLMNIQSLSDKYDVEILSYGNYEYQSLKMNNVPKLDHIKKYIVDEPKSIYIKRTFPDHRGLLVDDKPNQSLPKGWVEVNIDRHISESKITKVGTNVFKITKLTDIYQLI